MMKMKCQLIFNLSSGSNTAHLMVLKLRFKYCCRDDGETNDDDEQKNVIDAGRLSDWEGLPINITDKVGGKLF